MPDLTFHLLPNAHLDPVWLWDWREGLNEGIVTCRTMLDLMDEYEDLSFIRGEAVIYDHIRRHDPATFERICQRIADGRWDVVGGSWLQPDTNMPATESFLRQFRIGLRWFQENLRQRPRIVWTADSFGHSAGLPEIYAAAGMTGIAFSRPSEALAPIGKPLFWWEGPGGSRLLAWRIPIGWYGSERTGVGELLDQYLAAAGDWGIRHIPFFFGLGNHGGGSSRAQIEAVMSWRQAHPEVTVTFSGMHRVFDAMREDLATMGEDALPVHRGEINFCLRGCYVSCANLKFAYRRAEAALGQAETIDSALAATLARQPAPLEGPWRDLLFNAFHDILPGSSIESAIDAQLAQLGRVAFTAQETELAALNALAERVDTTVPAPDGDMPARVPRLLFNPHPFRWRGPIEIETHLDYRPIFTYRDRPDELPVEVRGPDGRPVAHQCVHPENRMLPTYPWRVRTVIEADLPALGWAVYDVGYVEGAENPSVSGPAIGDQGRIGNGSLDVTARPGGYGVQIDRAGEPLLGAPGLSFITVEDPYGSWGEMQEDPASFDLSNVRHEWRVSDARVVDAGPLRATLWTRLTGGNSWIELTVHLYRGREVVDIEARLLWNERAARLKMVMPCGAESAIYDVPGAVAERPCDGREVPGGRWVKCMGPTPFGFASNAIYGFDVKDGALRASIARASGFATTDTHEAHELPWRPTTDAGLLRFRCCLTADVDALTGIAAILAQPPVVLHTWPSPGGLPRRGSLAALSDGLELLAMTPADDKDGWEIRLQNRTSQPLTGEFTWGDRRFPLGTVAPFRLHSWLLRQSKDGWSFDSAP